MAGVTSLKTRLRPLPRRLSLSGTVTSSLSDPIHMQSANRKLLGLSVWAMKHSFTQLCAEHGFPISEERCLPSPKVDREDGEAVRRSTPQPLLWSPRHRRGPAMLTILACRPCLAKQAHASPPPGLPQPRSSPLLVLTTLPPAPASDPAPPPPEF